MPRRTDLQSILVIGALVLFLHYTRFGYAIRATTQNRAAAQLMGVNVGFVCLITFGIGLALAGAAGAIVSFVFSFFPAKQWDWIAILLALVVLGGMGVIADRGKKGFPGLSAAARWPR